METEIKKPHTVRIEQVNHPQHYGGDTTYEVIKVIEAWELDFHLGNCVKYIARAGKKQEATLLEDLEKAKWYLQRRIDRVRSDALISDEMKEEHQSRLERNLL